jgi:hypothetical protein
MRILRTIFCLAVVTVLMPTPPEDMGGGNRKSAATGELLSAAVNTVADVNSFCSRQASVCDTANLVAVGLEAKAKYSVRLIYEWANESRGGTVPDQAFETDRLPTASVEQVAGYSDESSQNTLRVDDLIPDWRDPKQQRQS